MRYRSTTLPFALPAVTPVVHVADADQALSMATLAGACGADGIWLIEHDGAGDALFDVALDVRRALPDLWIGINCLGYRMGQAVRRLAAHPAGDVVAGYWSDDAGVVDDDTTDAEDDARLRVESGWNGTYFGGVAFKYQAQPADLERTARRAVDFCDVICTSGAGTGRAAEASKLQALRAAVPGHPIAIASGVTCDNVGQHLGLVDVFLVATGISLDFHTLDPERTERLIRAVHAAR